MEQQVKHQELFRGEGKKLGYFLDQANGDNDGFHFFRVLTQDIVNEITGAKYCESFRLKYDEAVARYNEKRNKVTAGFYQEIKHYFACLRADIEAENLLNDESLNAKVANLDQLLVKIGFDLPSIDSYFLQNAWEAFREICDRLICLDRVDIVQGKYVEIIMIPRYTGEGLLEKWIDQPVIESLIFKDWIEQLRELDEVFHWDSVSEPWVAWYYLQLAAQCYNYPSKSDLNDLKDINSNKTYKLNFGVLSYEMNAIKGRDKNIYIAFFTINRFNRYLTMVMSSILGSQREAGVLIHSLGLSISNNNELFLIVRKHKNGDGNRYKISKPNGESQLSECRGALLLYPGNRVDMRDFGYSVSKFKSRVKVPKKIWDIFFTEIDGSIAMLNGNPIVLEDSIDIDHSALMEEIEHLEKMD